MDGATVRATLTQATTVAYDLRPLLSGRWDLMTAQHWGVVAGIVTYTVTVSVVIILLVVGGTCTRLREQNEEYELKGPAAFATPFQRSLLYDELLDAASKLPLKPKLPSKTNKNNKTNIKNSQQSICEIKGEYITLQEYNKDKHLSQLYSISNGNSCYAHGPYDPEETIFRFLDDGPFKTKDEFNNSNILNNNMKDGIRMIIIDNTTNYIVGMISLTLNEPKSLKINISDMWITPGFQRTHIHTNVMYTLLNYLFKELQYRRIEIQCNSDDARTRKSIERIGFIYEGILRKHKIIRNSNQDTSIYSILNSDWRDGGELNLKNKLKPPCGVSSPTRQPVLVGNLDQPSSKLKKDE